MQARGYLGLKMQMHLCVYSLWNVYMCFPRIKALFHWVTNGSSIASGFLCPFPSILGGMPVWAGSVGSVFWDCSWGCLSVNREKKETKTREKRRREEKASISETRNMKEQHEFKSENVDPSVSCLYLLKMILL